MPMPLVLASIAQQGQAGGGGGGGGGGGTTAPTVATSSSGNYDSAFLTNWKDSDTVLSPEPGSTDGSEFSSGTGSNNFEIEAAGEFSGANNMQCNIGAYIREGSYDADGAAWSLHSLLATLSGGASASLITSSYSSAQDSTNILGSNHGIGAYVKLDAGGGRGGLVWGVHGDSLSFSVKGQIDGEDTANVTLTYNFVGA